MTKEFNRKIVLEDGSEYYGYGFGADVDCVCEIAFTTGMAGYQEVVSNPSCIYKMVVMTYPLIGNYGVTDEDYETKNPVIGGLIVREYNDLPSNFRYTKTLAEIMEEHKIPGIFGLDTRKLTRHIRDFGSQKVLITSADTPLEEALKTVKETEIPKDAVAKVSSRKRWYSRTTNAKYNIVAIDLGMKMNNVRELNARRCNVTVVPWNTSAETIESMNPDGIFISNGPGNPKDVPSVVELIKTLKGKYPMFGICLGHQLISLAYGADTYQMKHAHSGGNHPVKDLATGKIGISAQNHGFAVDEKSLEGTDLELTHINVIDKSVEGVACNRDNVFSVQFHPESAAGPQDFEYLFDQFIDMIKEGK